MSNVPVKSKLQHLPPPPPVFELLKIGLFRFPHLGAKQLFKLMPHQLVLKYLSLKTNFLFSHSERYAVLTPSNFFVNLSNLAKMKKTHRNFMPEQQINPFKFPTLPKQRSNSPLPGHKAQSNAGGEGGC